MKIVLMDEKFFFEYWKVANVIYENVKLKKTPFKYIFSTELLQRYKRIELITS